VRGNHEIRTPQLFNLFEIFDHTPWQNCFVERMIGSIRRECLNHVIVLNENHLRRLLKIISATITNPARTCP
jgi:hypothetical protein